MIFLHIVLWYFAVVLLFLFGEEVGGVDLLQKGIALVLLIRQNTPDGRTAPVLFAAGRRNAKLCQFFRHFAAGIAIQKQLVNQLNCLCLFLIDHKVSIGSTVITKEPAERHGYLAIRKTLTLSPCGIL